MELLDTTAPTGTLAAAETSQNQTFKQVPQSSTKFNQEQNRLKKTIKGVALNAMQQELMSRQNPKRNVNVSGFVSQKEPL